MKPMFWRRKVNGTDHSNTKVSDYHAVAVTDTGNARDHNEDAVRFVRPTDPVIRQKMGFLAIVADGMGGHASGEVASSMAVEVISEEYYAQQKKPVKALKKASMKANLEIWQLANTTSKLKGMGTTCTVAAIVNSEIYIAHIGDSRAYLYKNGNLIQLSVDHTYVQDLLNSGEITPTEALNHPDGNVLTKSLGTEKKRNCDVFLSNYRFEKGDRLLLCSDGVYEYFSNQELAEYLSGEDLRSISKQLSESVLKQGAHDNFSILLVEEKADLPKNDLPTRAIPVEL